MIDNESFLTTKEIASLLQVNIITIRRWIAKGELPAIRLAKEFRIAKKDFDRFLEKKRVKK